MFIHQLESLVHGPGPLSKLKTGLSDWIARWLFLKQLYALVCLRHVFSAKEALISPDAKLESFPSSNILLKGAVVFEYLHLVVEVVFLRPGQKISLQW